MTLITKEVVERALDARKNTISEKDFVGVWLPAFAEGLSDVAIMWIKKVSGHQFGRVAVIGDSGEKLFEVPAMMPSLKTNEISGIHGVVNKYEKYAEIAPVKAEEFLIKSMGSISGSISNEHFDEWIEILGRYGYMDLKKKDDTAKRVDEEYKEDDLF